MLYFEMSSYNFCSLGRYLYLILFPRRVCSLDKREFTLEVETLRGVYTCRYSTRNHKIL